MKLPAPALIRIYRCGMTIDRIAAFTWTTKSGIAWLEDSYLQMYGGNHAFHVLEGELRASEDGIYLGCEEGYAKIYSQEQVRADPELCPEHTREPFLNARDVFRTDFGKDWAEEFERMTEFLAPELGR